MYTCRWFVLCETVVHDAGSNNLTIVNALTELRSSTFPSGHPRFGFATLLEREGEPVGALSVRFVRENASGDEVLVTVSRDATPERVQFFLNFPAGIRLFNDGKLTFRIEAREGESDWYSLGTQDILIVAVQQPEALASQATDPASTRDAEAESGSADETE